MAKSYVGFFSSWQYPDVCHHIVFLFVTTQTLCMCDMFKVAQYEYDFFMRRTLLLVEIMSRTRGLVLYSNGRADSPSYSAKFGYTIVVFHTNNVFNV
jgi:hypothetical protein